MEKQKGFDNRKKAKNCPCGKSNKDGKFSPFRGHTLYGHCFSCGKNFWPHDGTLVHPSEFVSQQRPKPTYFPENEFNKIQSQNDPDKKPCHFIAFLFKIYPKAEVLRAARNYKLHRSDHVWQASTIFWQIDEVNRIRSGKIMLYDARTGKRVKYPTSRINWLHRALKMKNYSLDQCLFGLHLLNKKNSNVVCIVESEKTAVIMSIEHPEYIWMATGSKGGLKQHAFKALRQKTVKLFPDKGEVNLWQQNAKLYALKHQRVLTSTIMEDSSFSKGADLADLYLSAR